MLHLVQLKHAGEQMKHTVTSNKLVDLCLNDGGNIWDDVRTFVGLLEGLS